jgi:type VI secretion system protein VasD
MNRCGRNLGLTLLLLVGLGGLGGCGGAPPPTVLDMSLQAAADANAAPGGAGAPVRVSVFQLGNPTAFTTADYFELNAAGGGGLGGAVLAVDEVLLLPGDRQSLRRQAAPQATHVGAVAAFRDLDGAIWRAVVPLEVGRVNEIDVRVAGRRLSVDASGR